VCVQEALGVTVNQSCQSLSQRAQVLFDPHQGRALGGGVGLQSASVCLGQPLRRRQEGLDLLPDGQVESIRPDLGMLTDPLPGKARRVGPSAPGRGVCPRRALASAGAEAFPIVRRAALLARDDALQEREGAAL
jgi:hypothetical protein